MSRQLDRKEERVLAGKGEEYANVSDLVLNSIDTHIQKHDGKTTAAFKGLQLTSAFQPIFSLAHRRAIGHEALLRACTFRGDAVSPLDVFGMVTVEAETTHLDRLCRALHVRTYQTMGIDNSWLFLNVNPVVVTHGRIHGAFFSDLLARYGFPAHRVVVEILEDSIHDESQLAEAVGYYRNLGCLVAIDDFGSGHSNFERIWRIAPDIVKLDRSIITQASSKTKVRRVLPSLVSLLHEAGCLVVMEGVESESEALIAVEADVDFVQGFYFGRPTTNLVGESESVCALTQLCDRFKHVSAEEWKAQHDRTAAYVAGFKRCADAMESGIAFEPACMDFVGRDGVARCYLLDAEGVQIGANLTSPSRAEKADPRFLPLEDVSGARWFRRSYFRRAIGEPGQVHKSRPYLSLTGTHMCVTLAVAMACGGARQVLCCDLNWD